MHRFFSTACAYKRIRFIVLLIAVFLLSDPAYAQTPACPVSGDAGNSYETCTSGVCERFVCNGSAYVTVNSRAFAGWESIKFGNDTQTCNSARAGRLRYTGGSTWEYCNSSAWTAFGGGAGDGPTYLIGSGSTLSNPSSYTVGGSLSIPANAIVTTKPFKFVVQGSFSHFGETYRWIYMRSTYGGTSTSGVGATMSATAMAGSFVYEATFMMSSTTQGYITEELRAYNESGDYYDSAIRHQYVTLPATTSSRTLSIDLMMTGAHANNQTTATKFYVEY